MYYKNELYSDKGQFCWVDNNKQLYIMFENDGTASIQRGFIPPEDYLSPPWYPITEEEFNQALKDFKEIMNK